MSFEKNLKKKFKKWIIAGLPLFIKRDKSLFIPPSHEKYGQMTYSQEGEDMILKRYFGQKREGFYVDVGAHHPFRFSNTYLLYKQGWRGINIDAMPGSMKAFNKNRPRDINIECGIGNSSQNLKYYIFNELALNTFSKEEADKKDKLADYYIEKVVEIPVLKLETVLDKYLEDGMTIDLLTIDAEGLDWEVIQSLNIKRYKPSMIVVEDIENREITAIENNSQISKLLLENHYSMVSKTHNTVFYLRSDV